MSIDLELARAEVLVFAARLGERIRPGAHQDSGSYYEKNTAENELRAACIRYAQAMRPDPPATPVYCTCGVLADQPASIPDPQMAWRHTPTCPHNR